MSVNQYQTLVEALNDLNKKGYSSTFNIAEGVAICLESKQRYSPEDMMIIEYHRFEGDSSAGDMSVLYVIDCSNGVKGVIVDAYGMYSNKAVSEFIKQVKLIEGLS